MITLIDEKESAETAAGENDQDANTGEEVLKKTGSAFCELFELTDGVDSQHSEQQVVALLSEQLVPQQTHQSGAGERPRGAPHREPQHRATQRTQNKHTQQQKIAN